MQKWLILKPCTYCLTEGKLGRLKVNNYRCLFSRVGQQCQFPRRPSKETHDLIPRDYVTNFGRSWVGNVIRTEQMQGFTCQDVIRGDNWCDLWRISQGGIEVTNCGRKSELKIRGGIMDSFLLWGCNQRWPCHHTQLWPNQQQLIKIAIYQQVKVI